jgi:hypothetical protein
VRRAQDEGLVSEGRAPATCADDLHQGEVHQRSVGARQPADDVRPRRARRHRDRTPPVGTRRELDESCRGARWQGGNDRGSDNGGQGKTEGDELAMTEHRASIENALRPINW